MAKASINLLIEFAPDADETSMGMPEGAEVIVDECYEVGSSDPLSGIEDALRRAIAACGERYEATRAAPYFGRQS